MPNWCYTRAVVYGPTENVVAFKKFIDKALEDAPNKEADNPSHWLGQLVIAASGDKDNCYCRGWIQDISEIEGNPRYEYESFFFIDSNDAWSPILPNVLSHVIASKFPDEELYIDYIAEEGGCGIYVNTDTEGTYFPERYLLVDDCDYYYFKNEQEVYRFLKNERNAECSTLEEVEKWAAEQECCGFYRFEAA